jgi:multicomponent Na+:H+ antiporter subunit G
MREIIIMILATIGVLFIFSTSLAMLRKPDVYLRISVTAKASTLGVGLILFATALFFNEYSVTTRAIAVILFVFLTVPLGSHMLARSAYFTKTPIWKGTEIDDLQGQYDPDTHILHSKKHNSSIKPEKSDKPS